MIHQFEIKMDGYNTVFLLRSNGIRAIEKASWKYREIGKFSVGKFLVERSSFYLEKFSLK